MHTCRCLVLVFTVLILCWFYSYFFGFALGLTLLVMICLVFITASYCARMFCSLERLTVLCFSRFLSPQAMLSCDRMFLANILRATTAWLNVCCIFLLRRSRLSDGALSWKSIMHGDWSLSIDMLMKSPNDLNCATVRSRSISTSSSSSVFNIELSYFLSNTTTRATPIFRCRWQRPECKERSRVYSYVVCVALDGN